MAKHPAFVGCFVLNELKLTVKGALKNGMKDYRFILPITLFRCL
jgi:hypothetical protein